MDYPTGDWHRLLLRADLKGSRLEESDSLGTVFYSATIDHCSFQDKIFLIHLDQRFFHPSEGELIPVEPAVYSADMEKAIIFRQSEHCYLISLSGMMNFTIFLKGGEYSLTC